ncbi:oligosaccharide flippase family protein [Siccirubricoccus sp. KC 17139]|uniref:Oligosaccharide flippase family protein n=1 Tax=Siccirubricoccus soli TaxID=2899147 RepID=A0ABT1D031_9PROT|nr:oligosaccharide flippase family protein [Siccirubricoccus soli]MCO6415242.1 oligosaccharide flippase family protein [Siccirubricoccus soli]MCP2681373.1 oligosaccharide flippase family protein [Siccirubricoccus soli]
MASILARTAIGAGWVFAWRLLTRLLGLASTLVLARLLAPADFGLVALAYACGATLDACLNVGLDQQIIRAKEPTRRLYDTVFTLNLLRGLAISAALVAAAGPLAGFFGDPRLHPVLLVLALLPVLNGVTNVGVVDFHRNLDFRADFLMMSLPRLLGVAIAIGGGLLFRTHWALVASLVAARFTAACMSYALHRYRPRLSLAAWRELVGVSVWTWAVIVTLMLRDRADGFFIGRLAGTAAVGAYNIGSEIATLPGSELAAPIARACMPSFAVAGREGGETAMADSYRRITALTALLMLPAGFGITFVGAPLIFLAVGPAWQAAVPVTAIFGLVGVTQLFSNIGQALLSSQARMRQLCGIFVVGVAVRLGLMALLIPAFGLVGAAVAACAGFLLDSALMLRASARMLRIPVATILGGCWRPSVAALLMAAALWAAGYWDLTMPGGTMAALSWLLGAIGLGVAVFATAMALLWYGAGRPEGAEADLLRLLGRVTAGLRGRLRRGRPAAA